MYRNQKFPSVLQHEFSSLPSVKQKRSKFSRSHGYTTTFDAGYLIPVFFDEALPGDTFELNMHSFARLATPLFPVMDNMFMDVFFFSVPNRLLWDNWEKFMGAKENPSDVVSYVTPKMTAPAGGYVNGSLSDYLGIPTEVPGVKHTAFWHRAYNRIYNEWFRDQNLQDSVDQFTDNGPDDSTKYVLLRRGKRHDYFTSCLPWPQKGDSVKLPLGTSAPVVKGPDGDDVPFFKIGTSPDFKIQAGGSATSSPSIPRGRHLALSGTNQSDTAFRTLDWGDKTGLQADLTTAVAATVNQLRQAFATQRLLEKDAVGGTRYVEILLSHFGVQSPDFRLQRSEYLGGCSVPVNVSPIAQTSATESSGTALGDLAAYGTASTSKCGFKKSFVEHCTLLGLVSVRADLRYQNGLDRMFSRDTRLDYYWPALAHIGEQAVLNKEIFAQATSADDDVFGYQERYAEYRYKPSKVTAQMRSNFSKSLDKWHLAQDFQSLPTLNSSFIQDTPPIDRIKAVTDNSYPDFLFDSYFTFHCTRPMPVYSIPSALGGRL